MEKLNRQMEAQAKALKADIQAAKKETADTQSAVATANAALEASRRQSVSVVKELQVLQAKHTNTAKDMEASQAQARELQE